MDEAFNCIALVAYNKQNRRKFISQHGSDGLNRQLQATIYFREINVSILTKNVFTYEWIKDITNLPSKGSFSPNPAPAQR